MKKIITLFVAAVVASSAYAMPISGSIGFVGTWSGNGTQIGDGTGAGDHTSISFADEVVFGARTGDYASIPVLTAATFSDIDLTATAGAIWSLVFAGDTFAFTSTSYTVTRSDDSIEIDGSGIATITGGFDPTAGSFVVTVNEQGANFTFSSSTVVPETGSTIALLGLGLAGLGTIARRRK